MPQCLGRDVFVDDKFMAFSCIGIMTKLLQETSLFDRAESMLKLYSEQVSSLTKA